MNDEPMDLSEPMTLEVVPILTDEQMRRVEAVKVAKPLLTGQGLASRTPPTVDDLIRLAEWVISGTSEPLYPYTDTEAKVHLGPNIWMVPDGYLYVNGDIYEPVTEDSDGD